MKLLLLFILALTTLFSSEFKVRWWKSNESFSQYLTRHHIDSTKFYNQISPDDIKFISSIESGTQFFERTNGNKLVETLIPLGEEMQIYVYLKDGEYKFDIIPIKYKIVKDRVGINIENNCFSDIKKATNNPDIATYLKSIFKGYVDFTKLQKGDFIAIDYEQKSISGLAFGEPKIKAAYIQAKNKEYLAILKGDEYKIYSNDTKDVQYKKVLTQKSALYKHFRNPLSTMRITSTFTYKRWHPILHRYRPHLGIDIGAKRGTPIYAIADGKVIYAGWMRGYGRVTKIAHGGGYVSLYAHQSKILVKKGQIVKAHQIIGKVGSTGRSTGPHLHLGVYKRGKPINPFRVLNKLVKIKNQTTIVKKVAINSKNIKNILSKEDKKVYNLLTKLSKDKTPYFWKNIDKPINIKIIAKKERKDNNVKREKEHITKGAA